MKKNPHFTQNVFSFWSRRHLVWEKEEIVFCYCYSTHKWRKQSCFLTHEWNNLGLKEAVWSWLICVSNYWNGCFNFTIKLNSIWRKKIEMTGGSCVSRVGSCPSGFCRNIKESINRIRQSVTIRPEKGHVFHKFSTAFLIQLLRQYRP